MSTYDPFGSLSYNDYLQAKSFVRDITFEVSSQGRAMVASNKQLERSNLAIRSTIAKGMDSATEVIAQSSAETSAAIRELSAVFKWEFAQALAVMGRMADSLEELIRIAKNQAKGWAYEKYHDALNAVRQDLYDDADESIKLAIDGSASNTGYKLDYRFHFLLGTIRLGNTRNFGADTVRLDEAQQAFLDAAKYARTDYPLEAARALVAAGYAAYCQKNVDEAFRLTNQALTLNDTLGEAYFQRGKLHAHRGEAKLLSDLRSAIVREPLYAIRALDDNDYQKHAATVSALLADLRKTARHAVEAPLLQAKARLAELQGANFGHFVYSFPWIGKMLEEASELFAQDTYVEYLQCGTLLEKIVPALTSSCDAYLKEIEESLRKKLDDTQTMLQRVEKQPWSDAKHNWRFWCSLLSFFPALFLATLLTETGKGNPFIESLGPGTFWAFAVTVAYLVWFAFTRSFESEKRLETDPLEAEIFRLEKLIQGFPEFRSRLTRPPTLPLSRS